MTKEKQQKYDVVDAICAAMKMIGNVKKGGRNQHMNYDFASEQCLLLEVQPAIAAAGLAIEKKDVEILKYELLDGRKTKWHALVKITYDFVLAAGHAVNADNLRLQHIAIGAGEDHADKAIAKAQTMAFKYLLRNAFAIPTGDDPDETQNSAPAPQVAHDKIIILETTFKDRDFMKENGAYAQYDDSDAAKRSNNGRKLFKHWYVSDTPENRELFKPWIKRQQAAPQQAAPQKQSGSRPKKTVQHRPEGPASDQCLDSMKAWAHRYNGFNVMAQFCAEDTILKATPDQWSDDQISKFRQAFDSGRLQEKYDSFLQRINDDRKFPADEIDMTELPF